jgi:hypothetical protein
MMRWQPSFLVMDDIEESAIYGITEHGAVIQALDAREVRIRQ